MAKQLADKILEYLDKHDRVNSLDLVNIFDEDHQKVIGAIKSLKTAGDLIKTTPVSETKWEVTSEGEHVIKNGSHEAAVYKAVPDDGIPQAEIMKIVPFAKVGFSKALVAGWIILDKSNGTPIVRKKVSSIVDAVQNDLKDLANIPDNAKTSYKKRKLLQEIIVNSVLIEKGSNFSLKVEKLETELTVDLLANGAWKEKKFKPYNFEALGSALEIGHLHPLLKVKSEFRQIFLEMGFTEMPTNNYVESSFWNFDALFQPQQHPARDAHDTFFISEPCLSTNFPMKYLKKVKKVHSEGGYGSQGYRYEWKLDEAQKNLLRTHTTAVSARMLYKLMQKGKFKPVKYFSIDRVFRNETLDATHLAEFHQVEGVIADYNLTLGDLIGTLYEFFKKLGITQLQFKPAYNPYTEPSMEIFCYHNGLEKWIEIGNSGMFRPEMLLPMGLPEEVNVIAWGLSLERPTMIKYGLNNIRDLVGPRVDMEMVYNNPICRLDKTSYGGRTGGEKLDRAQPAHLPDTDNREHNDEKIHIEELRQICEKLLIFCDPEYPLRFLEPLFDLLQQHIDISVSMHIHSTVTVLPDDVTDFCARYQNADKNAHLSVTIIWKVIGVNPIMHLPKMHTIMGQVNIARYLNRLIELKWPNLLPYETFGSLYANQIDSHLDRIHVMLHTSGGSPLPKFQKRSYYLMGNRISIVDLILEAFSKDRSSQKSI
ncbi:hypothetical protein KM043_014524 [Ampulex compressa]|nr:hypothetical protein KM043_014524 [Ampulex compressa]